MGAKTRLRKDRGDSNARVVYSESIRNFYVSQFIPAMLSDL